jgi:uncharacterized sulfatase
MGSKSSSRALPRQRALKWFGLGLFVVVAVAVLYPAGRILLYHQQDDPQRMESKQRYLEQIAAASRNSTQGPNVIVILFDDLGQGDLGVYGGRAIRTPHIDLLAAQGARFTHAYAPAAYCSASRAGLLTGRYPVRAGLDHVLHPAWTLMDLFLRLGGLNRRLPAEEITVSDILSAGGYATAVVGKWHLGEESPSLPNDLGFDSFYGLLYSNDQGKPALWRDRNVLEPHPVDQATLTRRYTEAAVRFIEANRDHRFFLYLPHTFPHIPLHAARDRLGSSPAGLYGDVVEELDESVGAIRAALEQAHVAHETLVIVSSDNGSWFQGSSAGMRGRKMDIFEGGMRVPLVISWPGRIRPGLVVDDPVVLIDVLPTVLELTGLPAPSDRIIDGESLMPLLEGRRPNHLRPVFFHQVATLRAVREGHFKYHDRHGVFYGNPVDWPWALMKERGPWLFDLQLDPAESYDVSARYPEVAKRLRETLEERKRELAANPRGWR